MPAEEGTMTTTTLDEVNDAINKVGDIARRQPSPNGILHEDLTQKVQDAIRSVEAVHWLGWVEHIVCDNTSLLEMPHKIRSLTNQLGIETTTAQIETARENWMSSVKKRWEFTQEALRNLQELEDNCRRLAKITGTGPRNISELREAREIVADFMRALRLTYPEFELEVADYAIEDYSTIHIPPMGYLKSAWAVLWSAVRHPFSETVINLQTGEVMARE
jgi:hypothetical protein